MAFGYAIKDPKPGDERDVLAQGYRHERRTAWNRNHIYKTPIRMDTKNMYIIWILRD